MVTKTLFQTQEKVLLCIRSPCSERSRAATFCGRALFQTISPARGGSNLIASLSIFLIGDRRGKDSRSSGSIERAKCSPGWCAINVKCSLRWLRNEGKCLFRWLHFLEGLTFLLLGSTKWRLKRCRF